jgi:hypothetical protein
LANVDRQQELVERWGKRVMVARAEVSPECGEFTLTLDGVDHGGTYARVADDLVEVNILLLDEASDLLHQMNLPGILEDCDLVRIPDEE